MVAAIGNDMATVTLAVKIRAFLIPSSVMLIEQNENRAFPGVIHENIDGIITIMVKIGIKNSTLARNFIKDILEATAITTDTTKSRKICSKFLQIMDVKRKIREDIRHDAGSTD
jgi:hypothetical protein